MQERQIFVPMDFGDGSNVPFLVLHQNAQSYWKSSISSIYSVTPRASEEKDRIHEVESASFTPLVFSTTGSMGREGLTFYRRLADQA